MALQQKPKLQYHRVNINSELNTNSYELRVKYFQLSGAPIETDAASAYRKYKPQINADERRFAASAFICILEAVLLRTPSACRWIGLCQNPPGGVLGAAHRFDRITGLTG